MSHCPQADYQPTREELDEFERLQGHPYGTGFETKPEQEPPRACDHATLYEMRMRAGRGVYMFLWRLGAGMGVTEYTPLELTIQDPVARDKTREFRLRWEENVRLGKPVW